MSVSSGRLAQASRREADGERSGQAALSRGEALGLPGRRMSGEFLLFATSVLLSVGVPPATASASVHVAEVFTTGASGFAHRRMGNVRRDLVLRLAVPGAVGGVLGAYALSAAPVGPVRVGVSLYLMGLGGLVLLKALRPRPPAELPPRQVGVLGFCGGALDAIGGGGWGRSSPPP